MDWLGGGGGVKSTPSFLWYINNKYFLTNVGIHLSLFKVGFPLLVNNLTHQKTASIIVAQGFSRRTQNPPPCTICCIKSREDLGYTSLFVNDGCTRGVEIGRGLTPDGGGGHSPPRVINDEIFAAGSFKSLRKERECL